MELSQERSDEGWIVDREWISFHHSHLTFFKAVYLLTAIFNEAIVF